MVRSRSAERIDISPVRSSGPVTAKPVTEIILEHGLKLHAGDLMSARVIIDEASKGHDQIESDAPLAQLGAHGEALERRGLEQYRTCT
jgi:hypothetical protein